MDKKEQYKSKIGGQAVIEGIMMRGVEKSALAIRLPDQTIDVEIWDNESKKNFLTTLKKIPFVRGIFNMASSLATGYKCLMKSAEKADFGEEMEEEPSKFDAWLEKKFGDKLVHYIAIIGAVLGVVLSVVLFMFFPALVIWAINQWVDLGIWKGALEGFLKISIFIVYLAAVSRMKDIARVFEYHGAEHKTIACLEAGEELTVENIKKHSRFHPRCGTSFMILVLILSILIFSVVSWNNPFIRTLIKLALLPVLVGVTYEVIKIAGRYDNIFTRIISFPGIKLQHLTTREPDDSQIEVAIAAINPVIPEDREKDQW